ncbi:hypothetical protein HWV07_10590 [Natronomonas salina]|uniref:hypothetical protein n=1 Tax=Natronomonas salina TaxID=1710540 RepID=UPI0015B5F1E1|nr:hypothetical protein [Natronomonas salina]QLD89452.1 hypothetical protein HWV07_10590 [Natronomonas salina]
MVDATLQTLGVIFAIIAGTCAGVLSIQFWRRVRGSPFGAVVALLSVTMCGVIAYHVVAFFFQPDSLLLDVSRSVLQTGAALFVWLVIATHRRFERDLEGR